MSFNSVKYSPEAIKRISIFIKNMKGIMNDRCITDVFTADDKAEALDIVLTAMNSTPPFTCISFENADVFNYSEAITDNAVVYLENKLEDINNTSMYENIKSAKQPVVNKKVTRIR